MRHFCPQRFRRHQSCHRAQPPVPASLAPSRECAVECGRPRAGPLYVFQWTKPPEGDPAAAHAARAPAPPLPSGGGGGSSLWQQKKWEQPDWAGGWAPHRGAHYNFGITKMRIVLAREHGDHPLLRRVSAHLDVERQYTCTHTCAHATKFCDFVPAIVNRAFPIDLALQK